MKTKALLAIAALVVLAVMSSGCVRQDAGTDEDGKINIIVSILPQKEFARSVGGDYVSVAGLIPSGASPATYELSTTDAVNIEDADIYFMAGHIAFEEAHIQRIEAMNPGMLLVDTSEGIALRHFTDNDEHEHEEEAAHEDGEHGGVDPHLWLSPKNVMVQVETMYETLAEFDPEHAPEYRENADAYIARLGALDESLERTLAGVSTKKMLVFHPAWGYFADEYGFEQVAIEQEGKEPAAESLARIIDTALEHDIKVIFVQSQFSTETAQSVAEQIGGAVVQIDPLAENYVENLRQAGETISDELGG